MILAFASLGAVIWLITLVLPWRPWLTSEKFESSSAHQSVSLEGVSVLIPARNEAEVIGETMRALNAQSESQEFRVVLVDDQSEDGTGKIAGESFDGSMIILKGKEPKETWSGKLWALQQGLKEVKTKYTLLMDADIQLGEHCLKSLVDKLEREKLDFVSLMVLLRTQNVWEKLLIPAYIYFFKLLYPFRLANNPRYRSIAAAAGGCILVRTEALKEVGAFESIKDALIDDCTLASQMKRHGFKTWLGLTHSAYSHRPYPNLASIWNLIARTAFTFLRYNYFLAAGCLFLMACAFVFLPVAIFGIEMDLNTRLFLIAGLFAMYVCYAPTVRFYKLSPIWLLLLPVSGVLYMSMVFSSVFRYSFGKRSQWKGRVYKTKIVEDANDELKKAS